MQWPQKSTLTSRCLVVDSNCGLDCTLDSPSSEAQASHHSSSYCFVVNPCKSNCIHGVIGELVFIVRKRYLYQNLYFNPLSCRHNVSQVHYC